MNKLLINGKWVDSVSGETLPVYNPSTGAEIARIARGTTKDIDLAVAAARAALDGPWGRMTAVERGRIMVKMSEIILSRTDELMRLEALDTGKPFSQARADIITVARYFEFYGTAADKVHGDIIPYMNDYHVIVTREPLGVTGHIIPWNYPAQMFGRSLAPALAMGNATVMKPSEDACLTPLKLAEIAIEAGIPAGVINIVTGLGEEAGAALTAHKDINFLSFTGSPEVGTMVQKATAENHVKCVLELGGKSPQIVFADADFQRAASSVIKAIVQNAGQTCSAGSRLLIQESVYDQFLAVVIEQFNKITVGSPEEDKDCGPLINTTQLSRVQHFINSSIENGIPVIAQGTLSKGAVDSGYYVKPTLFGPVPRQHRLSKEEVFGPVLSVMSFKDEADAIALANDTDFGLLAGIWTSDGSRQTRLSKAMKCGQVYINCYGAGGGVELPFGGVKKSGHGREKGFLALEEVSNIKTIVQFYG